MTTMTNHVWRMDLQAGQGRMLTVYTIADMQAWAQQQFKQLLDGELSFRIGAAASDIFVTLTALNPLSTTFNC